MIGAFDNLPRFCDTYVDMPAYSFKNAVVLVRHGQTQWNLEKRAQGHLDSPLTAEGILQARETARRLKDYKFDVVVCSPLGRALETAKIVAGELDVSNIKTDPNLAERNLGVLQGRTKEESLKNFPHFFDANSRFIRSSDIPEAESLKDFLERTKRAVLNIQDLSESKNVLVVTHDGTLNAFLAHVKGVSLDEIQKLYRFEHGEPVKLV